MLISLSRRKHELSSAEKQLKMLDGSNPARFQDVLRSTGNGPLKSDGVQIMQINLGKMCNQACVHCHVDAGPDRKEIMSRRTLQDCLEVLKSYPFKTVDLTGGAPEMNPDFRWFVESVAELNISIIVRCNLTIILANPKFSDLPQFFAKHRVRVVSSLPHFAALRTDKQRGNGVFVKSIKALQLLNDAGYGKKGTNLHLDLVYNPSGAFLPADQVSLERDFKRKLKTRYGVSFNGLLAITNMPISRFLEFLVDTGNFEKYIDELVQAFNPSTLGGLMCRSMISVGWDGRLYDCDFNQMLEIGLLNKSDAYVSNFDWSLLEKREIITGNHCFGCTAGAGSSCGGEIV